MDREAFSSIAGLLAFYARTTPAQNAIMDSAGNSVSYAELWVCAERVRRQLRQFGVASHHRVAVVLPRGADNALALVVIAAAAVCVPINPDFTPDELQRYFADLRLAALVTSGDAKPASRNVAQSLGIPVLDVGLQVRAADFELTGSTRTAGVATGEIGPDDDAFVLLTSGTAARPKMVPLTQASVCLSAVNAGAVLSLTAADRLLNVLPLFHAHGLISGLLTALAAGSSVICTKSFDGASFFGWLRELQPTWYTAVPTIHRAVLAAALADDRAAEPSSLRIIRSASASLAPATLERLEALFAVPVVETYGMTEAASQIAANPRHRRKSGSVGVAAGPDIAIMDGNGREQASGQHGEIVLRGPTITRGYDNDQQATDAAFRDGWLRTGDLGFLDEDGYLFIVGRIKDVINRGGQKVSPLEVEETLLTHPDVLEAGAFGVPHDKLGENVAAVVVLRPGASVTPQQVRQLAASRLAAYKVPSLIHIVDEIPKGASGKITRSALPGLIASGATVPAVAPRSKLEAQLAAIWSKVLEVDGIGVDQDFFALGADSLAVTQVLSRLREQFGVDLTFGDVFDAGTIAALAVRLQASSARHGDAAPKWHRAASGGGAVALSFQQQRMYILSKLDSTKYNYNVVEVARLSGRLDVEALEAAIAAVARRHQILRSTFAEADGEPVQKVGRLSPRLEQIRLAGYVAGKRSGAIRREAMKVAHYCFDLEREPPFKATLLRFDSKDHALIVTLHHIATDGWSQRLLWQELAEHYSAARRGKRSPVRGPAHQYHDYVGWQQAWAQTQAASNQLDFWRKQLDGVTTLPLRTDRPRGESWTGRGARHYIKIPRVLSAAVKALGQQHSVTPFMMLLAAFQCLLCRYTGHEDVATGSLIANRNQIEAEPLIGIFANSVIMRTDLSGDPSFSELLQRVRRVTLDAYRNQDIPIEAVLRALQASRRDGSPPFQIMFILQNPAVEAGHFPGLSTHRIEIDPAVARFDITLELLETNGQFSGFFEYATDLFDADTIARMAGHFQSLLQGIATDPDTKISRLPLIESVERHRLLEEWKGASLPRRGNFIERFDRRVARDPRTTAASDSSGKSSYRELASRSLAIAQRLAREGVGEDMIVALLAERSVDLVAAMIAVQRAGAAFLCLDPAQPAVRLAAILQSAQPRLLLSSRGCASRLDEIFSASSAARLPCAMLDDIKGRGQRKPMKARAPSGLAYLIYTSGSTGAPKGVMIEQRGLTNHLASLVSELALSNRDVIAQTAPQSFVISVWQFLAGLTAGARVHICADAVVQDPLSLAQEMHREGVTVLQIVPSLLRLILERVNETAIYRAFAGLRLLISTGEPLPADVCRSWFQHFPGVPVINAYGASECSDDVSLHRLVAAPTGSVVSVGRPLPNVQLYVLDGGLRPLPIGVTGELYVGGDGVGRGYIGDNEQTSARFQRDPFSDRAHARLYRTGDLARWRVDGTLECLGRADQQVKVRGYRVELKEIEHVLLDHPRIGAAVIEPRREASGDIKLIAHVVATGAHQPSATELREFLKARLPSQAVPSVFLFLERMPLNGHGKVDRAAIAASPRSEPIIVPPAVEPSRSTEKAIREIWADLLKVSDIKVSDDFFDLGGHSLLAGRAMARIKQAFGVTLPIRTIFDLPTIEALAKRVDEARGVEVITEAALLPKDEQSSPAALSFARDEMTAEQEDDVRNLLARRKRELQEAIRNAGTGIGSPVAQSGKLKAKAGRKKAIEQMPDA
ncbi:amino acid adenylation domain-containing protein [uncultured Bradyrhizobium sp.]|uniref:amino acid adenylation domain-containing protein n=1 Tax=uncultured Bradyrhizobium sp. TaxID=199684 RepID=UPI00345C5546